MTPSFCLALSLFRWERVAELVPGKSKAQCFKRFKELRDAFRARKGGSGGAMPGDE